MAQIKTPSQPRVIPGVRHLLAISSGKGGVGKSTVSTNLAVTLAQQGFQVGLADLDLYGPNLPLMMGVSGPPELERVSEGGAQAERFRPLVAHGVKVLSLGLLIAPDQPIIWRGPMLHQLVEQFCHQVAWGTLDYLLFDLPPGTGDVQLSLSQVVPLTGAVLVTTPQTVSVQDVRRAFGMFRKVGVPVLGIVENMSSFTCEACQHPHYPFGQGGGGELARVLGTECLGQLPLLSSWRRAGDEGEPGSIRFPDSSLAKAFQELAGQVARRAEAVWQPPKDPRLVQVERFF